MTHDPDRYEALPVPEALTAAVLAAIARGESVEVRGVLTLEGAARR